MCTCPRPGSTKGGPTGVGALHAVVGLDVNEFALGNVDDDGTGATVPRELSTRLGP